MQGYLRRGVPWRPILAVTALAAPLLTVGAWLAGTSLGDHLLQVGLALLGAAAAFGQDEPAAAVVDAAPAARPARMGLRLLVLIPLGAAWTAAAMVAARNPTAPPAPMLLGYGIGVLATAAAIAAALRRAGRATPGEVAAGVVVLAVLATSPVELPAGWTSWASVGPEWRSSLTLWIVAAPVALLVLLRALSSRAAPGSG